MKFKLKYKNQEMSCYLDEEDWLIYKDEKMQIRKEGKNLFYLVFRKQINWVRTVTRIHRAILNAPDGTVVDHINHNGLDNRRKNLRIATYSQNSANRRMKNDSYIVVIYQENVGME